MSEPDTQPILRATDLRKTFAGPNGTTVTALDGVDADAGPGEFLALRGPSGCGKSTLLFVTGGLLRPDSGKVLLSGENLYALSPEARAARRAREVGFVFQQFHLVPYLSARDNVLAPALAQPIPDAAERADALLEQFGLTDRRHHLPAALSVGEQQRAALARALLPRPKLLLADEPTGNLDPDNADLILSRLATFAEEGGAVLMVTHDDRAAERANRVLHLEQGRTKEAAA